jgi:hypothetical protein
LEHRVPRRATGEMESLEQLWVQEMHLISRQEGLLRLEPRGWLVSRNKKGSQRIPKNSLSRPGTQRSSG